MPGSSRVILSTTPATAVRTARADGHRLADHHDVSDGLPLKRENRGSSTAPISALPTSRRCATGCSRRRWNDDDVVELLEATGSRVAATTVNSRRRDDPMGPAGITAFGGGSRPRRPPPSACKRRGGSAVEVDAHQPAARRRCARRQAPGRHEKPRLQ